MKLRDNLDTTCPGTEHLLYKVISINTARDTNDWVTDDAIVFRHNNRLLSTTHDGDIYTERYTVRYYDYDENILYTLCFVTKVVVNGRTVSNEFVITSASMISDPGVILKNNNGEFEYGTVMRKYYYDGSDTQDNDDIDKDLIEILSALIGE